MSKKEEIPNVDLERKLVKITKPIYVYVGISAAIGCKKEGDLILIAKNLKSLGNHWKKLMPNTPLRAKHTLKVAVFHVKTSKKPKKAR